jgi:hypothetical protein
MPSVKAFVLGNGRSRLQLDLHKLKPYGKIYGCNALYRDFTPDVLVATDAPMAAEIEKSNYASQYEFWTRNPTPNNYARKIDINYGFSSGPIAVSLAARNEHKPIYLLGFDLIGNQGKINNVYAGTENYRKEGEKETYWGNWLNQLTTIMKNQFPKSKFIRVVDKGGFSPSEWINLQNYSEQSYEEFLHSINNKSWQKQNV